MNSLLGFSITVFNLHLIHLNHLILNQAPLIQKLGRTHVTQIQNQKDTMTKPCRNTMIFIATNIQEFCIENMEALNFYPPFFSTKFLKQPICLFLVSTHLPISSSSHGCSHMQSRDNTIAHCHNNMVTQLFTYTIKR